MSFGVYTRVDRTNRNLLRNKSRYANTKKSAYEIQRRVKLEYTTHSPEELRKIKKKIWVQIRRDQKRRKVLTVISLLCGLIVAIWLLYSFLLNIV